MEPVLAALFGAVLGLGAHDLAVQALRDDPLRPLTGTCPSCRHPRGWHRPRCPNCSRRVGREFGVAAVTALVAWGLHAGMGLSPLLFPYLGLLMLTAALVVTDLDEMRIVNRLNLPGTLILAVVLAGVALAMGDADRLIRGVLGTAAYFGGSMLLWLLVRGRGFGAGDVKLSPVLGLFTAFISWGTLGWAVFATAMIGGVLGVAMLLVGAARLKTEIPYGPPMVVGAWAAILLAVLGAFPLPS